MACPPCSRLRDAQGDSPHDMRRRVGPRGEPPSRPSADRRGGSRARGDGGSRGPGQTRRLAALLAHGLAEAPSLEEGSGISRNKQSPGFWTASARRTPVVYPTAWRASWDAGCAPRGEQPAGVSGPTLPYGAGVPCFLNTASIAAWAHFSPSALDTPIEPITSPSSTIGNAPGCGKSCINVGARF
jgi:hypothetical protein